MADKNAEVAVEDNGGMKKTLSLWNFFTIGFGAIIGTGWVLQVGDWMVVGGGPVPAMIAFLLGAIFLVPVGAVFGELTAAIPISGGIVEYVDRSFGRTLSYITGWLLALGNGILCPWEAIAISTLVSEMFGSLPGLEWLRAVKLYTMCGLPTETNDDLEGIANLAKAVVDEYFSVPKEIRQKGLRVSVSTSSFVPKPFTPFQWEPQNTMEQLAEKQKFLREKLRLRSVTFSWSEPHLSFLEAAFARGDRRLCKVMLAAHRRGCRFDGWNEEFKFDEWMAAFEECGLTCSQFANKRFDLDAPLPWDHIDCGVTKEFLKREWHKAQNAQTSPDCRIKCHGCGMKQFVKGVCKSCE